MLGQKSLMPMSRDTHSTLIPPIPRSASGLAMTSGMQAFEKVRKHVRKMREVRLIMFMVETMPVRY